MTRIIKTGTTIETLAGLALLWDGAKEPQGLTRTKTIFTMNLRQETNVPAT